MWPILAQDQLEETQCLSFPGHGWSKWAFLGCQPEPCLGEIGQPQRGTPAMSLHPIPSPPPTPNSHACFTSPSSRVHFAARLAQLAARVSPSSRLADDLGELAHASPAPCGAELVGQARGASSPGHKRLCSKLGWVGSMFGFAAAVLLALLSALLTTSLFALAVPCPAASLRRLMKWFPRPVRSAMLGGDMRASPLSSRMYLSRYLTAQRPQDQSSDWDALLIASRHFLPSPRLMRTCSAVALASGHPGERES